MYPVRLVTGRTKGASHVLIYTMEDDEDGIIIVRILHERMDPTTVLS
ncbi:hypothetical protein C882_0122 [Caenispirillum salinarum AK4]|uniref:Uncharacterized protein n=2 Tax=Caenispirillum TaxID=414051 RepID=K9HNF6_9PROT|nr:hypothetical protein C882_0122 [Caenispirillum salinarum AK4]